MRRAPASTRQDVLEGPRNQRGAPGLLVHSQEAVALDAAADLEGVARCACFRGQRTDCQIASRPSSCSNRDRIQPDDTRGRFTPARCSRSASSTRSPCSLPFMISCPWSTIDEHAVLLLALPLQESNNSSRAPQYLDSGGTDRRPCESDERPGARELRRRDEAAASAAGTTGLPPVRESP